MLLHVTSKLISNYTHIIYMCIYSALGNEV